MSAPACAPPRAKNAAATRLAILQAATAGFVQESYENVGLRDIAASASVDVALVNRYFGSKKQLFAEVLRGCEDNVLPAGMTTADLPAYYADVVLRQERNDERGDVERLMIILRSASSPEAAGIVRDTLRNDVLLPLAALLEGDDADTRASLSMAVWIGTAILRNVMALAPLSDANCGMVHARLVKLFDAALAAD